LSYIPSPLNVILIRGTHDQFYVAKFTLAALEKQIRKRIEWMQVCEE
jgi:hypothetical protein